jgi:glycerophosphoryl diester phosphodiesterase
MFENLDSSLMISSHTASAPRLIAHRGLSSLYPENTLPAFEGAKEYGFDGFEFDVHTTKDGEWVVIHDDEVDHMTDGTGRVDSFTLEEILRLNIDNGNHIEEQGMKSVRLTIPTLSQTLDVCKDSDIVPVIEIKGCDVQYLPSLKQTLDEYGLSERAVIISFEEEYLEEYRKLDSDIEMLYLANTLTKEDVDWCIANDFGINYNCWLLYKNFSAVRYAEKNGVKIGAWTVDNTVFADVMVLFGAGYLTTNKILP